MASVKKKKIIEKSEPEIEIIENRSKNGTNFGESVCIKQLFKSIIGVVYQKKLLYFSNVQN